MLASLISVIWAVALAVGGVFLAVVGSITG